MGSYTCVRQPISLWSSNLEAKICFFKKKDTEAEQQAPEGALKHTVSALCLCGQPVLEDSAFKDTQLHKGLPPKMPGVLTTLSRIYHWDPVTFSADKIGNDENRGAEEPSGGKLSLGEGNRHSACMWQQSLHHPSTNTTPCSLLYLCRAPPGIVPEAYRAREEGPQGQRGTVTKAKHSFHPPVHGSHMTLIPLGSGFMYISVVLAKVAKESWQNEASTI